MKAQKPHQNTLAYFPKEGETRDKEIKRYREITEAEK